MKISCEEAWREIPNYLEGKSALLSIGLDRGERSPKWVRAPSTIEGPDLDRFRKALPDEEAPESRTVRNVKTNGKTNLVPLARTKREAVKSQPNFLERRKRPRVGVMAQLEEVTYGIMRKHIMPGQGSRSRGISKVSSATCAG